MTETPTSKINAAQSSTGEMGQAYLASGEQIALRMWQDESPTRDKPTRQRPYETVGYVLGGKAELHLNGQTVTLESGDSWVVPKNTPHTYRILETFSAIEATSPPARHHHRDSAYDE